jgi:hypothetical protein
MAIRQKTIMSINPILQRLGLGLDARMACLRELMAAQTLVTHNRLPKWACKDIYPYCGCTRGECWR